MFFSKSLLRCEREYESLKSSYEQLQRGAGKGPITQWLIGKPDRYPCVCLYNHCEDYNGPNYYDGEYVYIEDFENEVTKNDEIPMEDQ
jgi:hypothetical protein